MYILYFINIPVFITQEKQCHRFRSPDVISGIDVTGCHAHASLIVLNVSTGRHICILAYIQVKYCIYILHGGSIHITDLVATAYAYRIKFEYRGYVVVFELCTSIIPLTLAATIRQSEYFNY